jgi:hypothetical protein
MIKEVNMCNISLWGIYPLLELDKKYDHFLYDTYIKCEQYNELPECLFVLFSSTGGADEILDNLIATPNYFSSIDISEKYRLVIFTFPDKYTKDIHLLIDGKYSKLSIPAKNIIKNRMKYSDIHGILDKSLEMKKWIENKIGMDIGDNEVWDKMDLNKETLNINNDRLQ